MSTTVRLMYRHNRNSVIGGIGLILVIVLIVLSKNLPVEFQLPVAVGSLIMLIVGVGLMTFMYSYEARADRLCWLIAEQFDDPPNLWYRDSLRSEDIPITGKKDRFHKILRLTQPYDFSLIYGGDARLVHCMDVVIQHNGKWDNRIGLHDGYGNRGGVPVSVPGMDMIFVDILPAQTFKDPDDDIIKTFPVFELLFSCGADQKIMRDNVDLIWAIRRLLIMQKNQDPGEIIQDIYNETGDYIVRMLMKQGMTGEEAEEILGRKWEEVGENQIEEKPAPKPLEDLEAVIA